MMPTPEEIEAMAARGWTWEPEVSGFAAPDNRAVYAFVGAYGGTWVATYGTPGFGYGSRARHASPLLAADEAEAWICAELAKLKFPWLTIQENQK